MVFSSSHPPLPPISEEDHLSCLRLLRSRRVGAATFYRLIEEYGSAAEALHALPEIAREAGETRYVACPEGVARAEMRIAARKGARALWQGQPGYPALLAEIADAPPLLWVRGTLNPNSTANVGIVGARNASSLGMRTARRLSADLGAAGLTTVSGLARGIDTVAHDATLESGTIAVVAGGVDVTYPTENKALMDQIAEGGLVVSEMPMGTEPKARHFPRRNRIIAGLSRALVVVEAAAKSGSLITAELALDQGREVLAVPGHPFDVRAAGCNQLIRDGATLVRNSTDVLEALADHHATAAAPELPLEAPADAAPASATPTHTSPTERSLRDTATLHAEVLARLGPSPMAEDQLIRDFDATAAEISSALLDLEIDGRIERQTGGLVTLKSA